ncbi:ATP-binding protein [Aquabacterium sp.]|uniref:ATP-binding protein n=1 Tax=Aquabacterium sp. TaxID=1872578 RepID=UPI00378513E0
MEGKAGRTLDDVAGVHAIEARYRAGLFRAIFGVTVLAHVVYVLGISRVTPWHGYLTLGLALVVGLAVELGPARRWGAAHALRHVHGVSLIGTLYTAHLAALVAASGAAAGAPASWWMSVYPFYVILAGAIRTGLVLMGFTLAWFVAVFAAVAQGWLAAPPPQPGDDWRALTAMVASTAVLALFTVMASRRRFELRDALLANMERLAQEREQARADANAKVMLLANMSHELRTPLNGVIGTAELLATPELAPGQQRQLIGLMRQSADILSQLIDDVLDYAQLEAGRMQIDRTPIDPRATAFSVVELFAPRAHAKGIEIGGFFAADVPAMVEGDATRLRQVLANFISNAVKFTERGSVYLRCACEADDAGARWLRFDVEDSGIGLAPPALQRLFEPFVQASRSTAQRYGGSGLGLSICRQLAERMGGRVAARSAPGQGSVFSLWLPLHPLPGPGTIDFPPAPPLPGVCLMARSAFMRRHLAEMLALPGIALSCIDRLDPVALAALAPRSVLLIDSAALDDAASAQQLPAAIACMHALGSLPVLLSGTGSRDAPVSVTGATVVLYKPLRLSRLLTVLAQALEVQPALPASAAPPQAPLLQDLRVLLAEDNPVNQIIAQSMLEHLGAEVRVAASGAQTLDALGRAEFDLLLLDCEMPDVDGLEVARRWRAHEQRQGLARLPIVAVTGRSRREAWPACSAAGMDDFLGKPFLREQLVAVLRPWVQAQRVPGPA